MKPVSSTYKEIIASDSTRNFLVNIDVLLADDTRLQFTEADIMTGSFKIYSASSSETTFDLGAAIIGKCEFTLNNFDERFSGIDFFNATAEVWLKLVGDIEYNRIGIFTVDEPHHAGSLIALELLDNMYKFDIEMPAISYPITIGNALISICSQCGVTLGSSSFHGSTYRLEQAPDKKMNCREYIQYLAMICCRFCFIDDNGRLWFKWYTDDETDTFQYIMSRPIIGTYPLTITGVKIKINDTEYSVGEEGYMLTIENPLINESNVTSALNLIWDELEGFTFTTFELSAVPDYAPEVGDRVAIHYNGSVIYSYLTNFTFQPSICSAMLGAETPTRSLTYRMSKSVQTAVAVAKQNVKEAIGDYDKTAQIMNDLAINAMGAYQDYEDLVTGGRVYYLSNKPITKSGNVCSFDVTATVFKMTGDGFFVSLPPDPPTAQRTWINGYSQGQLVVNVLKTIGLEADWIIAGLLRDRTNTNYWNLNTGEFRLAGTTQVGSDGLTLGDLAEKDETIVDVDVEYNKNQSSSVAPSQDDPNWSTSSPQWQTGYYIWQRTKTTDGEGTVSYSDPVCIQGAKGQDGNSISSTTIEYGVSNSPSTMPSSWSTTLPSVSEGQYLWTKTTIDYTDPNVQDTVSYTYAKQGEHGQDGTSVTITSIKYQQGDNATTPPTGTWSDTPIIVAQGKYLWTKTTYSDNHTAYTVAFQGVNGTNGTDGVGISSTKIEYGVSNNASTQPSSWSTTVPTSVAQGKWLWVRTTYTYSNSTTKTVYTKSYVGTDGDDGTSITVVSVVKTGKVTTVTFSDGSTMTIDDGADGTNGVNGLNGYVHTAWALTIQGMDGASSTTGFSTSDSVGKKYLGTYTDNSSPDSTDWHSYSWSLIKGADGEDGDDGIGVSAIVEEYYLSTSNTTQTGGSWSTTQPAWQNGKYIWTRSKVTWTNNTTTTTTPILAQAINQANKKAYDTDVNLNQQEIYNRLTQNGKTLGIYLIQDPAYPSDPSKKLLYINGSYIATGIITDQTGTNYWNLDTGDLQMTAGARLKIDNPDYTGTYVPTMGNNPAQSWTTSEQNNENLGKTFKDTSTNGKTYVYRKTNASYPESDHPYIVNEDKKYLIRTGLTAPVKIKFDSRCETESNYDYLDVFYIRNSVWYKKRFTGAFGGQEVIVPSNYVYLVWHSDSSVTKWGWKIDSISETAESPSTFTEEQIPSGSYDADICAYEWVEVTVDTYTRAVSQHDINTNMTQEEIFNALTNNGDAQGLYLYNGRVYVNGQYVQAHTIKASDVGTDTLTVGGSNYSENAKIEVKNTSNTTVVKLNKDGIDAQQGTIGDVTLANGELYTIGEILIKEKKYVTPVSPPTSAKVLAYFTPSTLFPKSTGSYIKVDYNWVDGYRSMYYFLSKSSDGGSSYTDVETKEITPSSRTGSFQFNTSISGSDTYKWKISAKPSDSHFGNTVRCAMYVTNVHMVSVSSDGFYGQFHGSVEGKGNFSSIGVADVDIDSDGISADGDAWTLRINKNRIYNGSDSETYTGAYSEIDHSTPTITVTKNAGSSSAQLISLETQSNPVINVRSDSDSYIKLEKNKFYAQQSSSRYIRIESYPYVKCYYNSSNYIDISETQIDIRQSDSNYFILKGSGNLTAQRGSSTTYSIAWSTSDRRFKERIRDLDVELSKNIIDATRPVKFRYIDNEDKGMHYGMIAQEARKVLDDLGETDARLEHSIGVPIERESVPDPRTIDYQEYIPLLINYVKDLRAELDQVKAELAELKEGKT